LHYIANIEIYCSKYCVATKNIFYYCLNIATNILQYIFERISWPHVMDTPRNLPKIYYSWNRLCCWAICQVIRD